MGILALLVGEEHQQGRNDCLKTISFKTGKWTALEQGIRDQFIY
jgi:hypothetical protein